MPELQLLDSNVAGGLRRMEPASSGKPNRGFDETRESRFLKIGEEWTFYVDDAPLPSRRIDGRDIWIWNAGFYAGTVRAMLVRGQDKNGIDFLLDVSPDPGKVGQEHFQEMVGEVWAFDPALVIGDQSAITAIGELGETIDPSVRYMRLSTHADALVSSAMAICRDPHRTLMAARRNTPLHLVRRADLQTVRSAITRETATLFLDGDDSESTVRSGRGQPLFDIPVSTETFDSAANRTMSALLSLVIQAVDDISSRLLVQMDAERDDDSRQALSQRWPRRARILGDLRRGLQAVLAKEPFNCVRRKDVTAAGLTAIAAHPLYARTQQLIWQMLRPGYEGRLAGEQAAMSPTWAIFESWCFSSLATWLKERYPSWIWDRSTAGIGRYQLSGTSGAKHITLDLQRSFSYSELPPASGLWSVSSQLIPDIVLVARNGQRSSWIVLDAKYRRARRNVLDGMRSAHLYRDALRLVADPPAMSLLLIPAPVDDAAWILTREFQETHGVGAVVFSPGRRETGPLERFLDNIVGNLTKS